MIDQLVEDLTWWTREELIDIGQEYYREYLRGSDEEYVEEQWLSMREKNGYVDESIS